MPIPVGALYEESAVLWKKKWLPKFMTISSAPRRPSSATVFKVFAVVILLLSHSVGVRSRPGGFTKMLAILLQVPDQCGLLHRYGLSRLGRRERLEGFFPGLDPMGIIADTRLGLAQHPGRLQTWTHLRRLDGIRQGPLRVEQIRGLDGEGEPRVVVN